MTEQEARAFQELQSELEAAENRIDRLEHELRMLQDHLNEVSRPYGHYIIDQSS